MVEAKADHEAIGDFEAAVIDGNLDDAAGIAIQERADGERVGSAAGEGL